MASDSEDGQVDDLCGHIAIVPAECCRNRRAVVDVQRCAGWSYDDVGGDGPDPLTVSSDQLIDSASILINLTLRLDKSQSVGVRGDQRKHAADPDEQVHGGSLLPAS